MIKFADPFHPLIPANAGIQIKSLAAGRVALNQHICEPRPPAPSHMIWIPAFAGMSGFSVDDSAIHRRSPVTANHPNSGIAA
jgi:hypothetical protein